MGEKMKNTYLFPNILAKAMSKMDMKLQLESSMMSMVMIVCGLIISTIYITIYVSFPLWYKITVVINMLAGMVFLGSFLVTTFNQYRSYLSAVEFQKSLKGGVENAKKNT